MYYLEICVLYYYFFILTFFLNSRTRSMPVVPSRERVSCGVPGCDVSCERRFLKRHYSRKHPNQQIVLKNAGFGQGGRWRSWIKRSEWYFHVLLLHIFFTIGLLSLPLKAPTNNQIICFRFHWTLWAEIHCLRKSSGKLHVPLRQLWCWNEKNRNELRYLLMSLSTTSQFKINSFSLRSRS